MRRAFLLVLFVLALAVPSVLAQDPVKVDSKHYKVEFENSQVRVLRIKYGPHEKSVMHSHPASVAVFLTDTKGQFSYPDGKTESFAGKAGDAQYGAATTHLPENTGDNGMDVIVVELKGKATKAEMK